MLCQIYCWTWKLTWETKVCSDAFFLSSFFYLMMVSLSSLVCLTLWSHSCIHHHSSLLIFSLKCLKEIVKLIFASVLIIVIISWLSFYMILYDSYEVSHYFFQCTAITILLPLTISWIDSFSCLVPCAAFSMLLLYCSFNFFEEILNFSHHFEDFIMLSFSFTFVTCIST